MALVKCSECGKKISEKAKRCPNCGNPINKIKKVSFIKQIENIENKVKSSKKLKFIIVFVWLLLVLIAIIVSYNEANRFETYAFYMDGLTPVHVTTDTLCSMSKSKLDRAIIGVKGKVSDANRLNPGIVILTIDGGWWLTVPDDKENIDKVKNGTKVSVTGKLSELKCDRALITKFAYIDVSSVTIIK